MTASRSPTQRARSIAPHSRLARAIGLATLAALVGCVAAGLYSHLEVAKPTTDGVVVVSGSSREDPPGQIAAGATTNAPQLMPVTSNSSIPALKHALANRFPTLADAVITCDQTCTLTVNASTSADARFDASQLPYLGHLEDALRQAGFMPIGNLMIEELGDDRTNIRISFTPKGSTNIRTDR